jgi:hypothetical protein
MVGAVAWAAVLLGMLLVYRTVPGGWCGRRSSIRCFTLLCRSCLTRNGTRGRAPNPGDDQSVTSKWSVCACPPNE